MPMSTITQHTEPHNPHSANGPASLWGSSTSAYARDAFNAPGSRVLQNEDVTPTNGQDTWQHPSHAERERDRSTHAALTNSLQAALGGLQDQNAEANQIHGVTNGFGGEYSNGHGNGNANANGHDNGNNNGLNVRSGASSRRHSVSVVAGPAARNRGFAALGFGFSDLNNNNNGVHRHGPVHQAERETIYPQPWGGPSDRFRAGDEPQIVTLGSRDLGGYTDDDLLANGVNNQLSLRLDGDPVSVNVANSMPVPIGHGTSTMAPLPNTYRSNGQGPGSNYGNSPSGRGHLGRTLSQTSASPQYHNAEPAIQGSATGVGFVGSSQVWSGQPDRFRSGNNLGSPGSEWPTSMNDANLMSSIARDPNTFMSMAPGSAVHDPMGHTGNRVNRPHTGGFVAAPGHPGHLPQGAVFPNGHPRNAVPQQAPLRNSGPSFVPQRAPGQPMSMHGGFQPINARGPPGMGAPRAPMPPYGMAGHSLSPSDPRFASSHAGIPSSSLHRHPSGQANGNRNGFTAPTGGAYGPSPFVGPTNAGSGLPVNTDELGKGVPLDRIPPATKLYIVEFKEGRTDLFYAANPQQPYQEGDVVIVEADRGTDLGRIVNATVSLANVLDFVEARKEATAQAPSPQQQAQAMAQLGRLQTQLGGIDVGHADPAETEAVRGLNKEILPKCIFHKATVADLK